MVNSRTFIPECGDVIWITLSPQVGHEQAGRRPSVVLSPQSYNRKTGLALVCPITNQIKGYPFEVIIPDDLPVSGAILCDQVKNLDWRERQAELICTFPYEITSQIIQTLSTLLVQ